MIKKRVRPHPVSANNPCPFLRALVSSGQLSDAREPLVKVAAVVANAAHAGDGRPELPRAAIDAIASVANGCGPIALADTQWHGLRLNALQGGPLDKKGVGSGILNALGVIDLFLNRQFPERMEKRLRGWIWGPSSRSAEARPRVYRPGCRSAAINMLVLFAEAQTRQHHAPTMHSTCMGRAQLLQCDRRTSRLAEPVQVRWPPMRLAPTFNEGLAM